MKPTPHQARLGLAKLPVIFALPDLIVNVALKWIVQGGLRMPDNEKLPVSENEPGYGPVAVPLALKPIDPLSLARLGQPPDVEPPVDLPVPVSPSPLSEVTANARGAVAARRTIAIIAGTRRNRPSRAVKVWETRAMIAYLWSVEGADGLRACLDVQPGRLC